MKKLIAATGFFFAALMATPSLAEVPEADGGLYFSARAIGMNARDRSATGVDYDYYFGKGATFAIGYTAVYPDYGSDLRFEIEGSYRRLRIDEGTIAGVTFDANGYRSFTSAMANVLVDFHTQTRLVPYLGVGLGYTQQQWDDLVIGGAPQADSEDDFGVWQGIIGLGYRLTSGTILEIEYRYFNPYDPTYKNFISNELTIGARLTF